MTTSKIKNQKLNIKDTDQKSKIEKPATKVHSKVSQRKTIKEIEVKEASKVLKTKQGGISVNVYDMSGKVSGKVTLPGEIFNAKVNPTLMAQAVRVYLFSQRRGTASTKTRGEVAGTTKKMYRQKGTGKARHGAAKAPIFVGGGITFGPRPHDFSLVLPKKMKRRSLFSALTSKLQEKKVVVLDAGSLTGKTKEMVAAFKSLELGGKKGFKKVTVVVDESGLVSKAARNIEGATVENVSSLNTYTVLNSNTLLFLKDSLMKLEKTFLGEKV